MKQLVVTWTDGYGSESAMYPAETSFVFDKDQLIVGSPPIAYYNLSWIISVTLDKEDDNEPVHNAEH